MQEFHRHRSVAAAAVLVALVAGSGCSDDNDTPPPPPQPVRSVAYDVRDTTQGGQLTIFNGSPGGGSVGMPLKFGDVNGDGFGDVIACPMLADSGPAGDRRDSGEVHVYFGNGTISGVIVNTPDAPGILTFMGARAGDLLGNEAFVADY